MYHFKIFKRITILIICCFFFSCSKNDDSETLTGFWISAEKKVFVEFSDSYVVFKPFDNDAKPFTASLEKIDSKKFRIFNPETEMSGILTADWKAKLITFEAELDQGKKKSIVFKKAPNVKIDDTLGTWFQHGNQGDNEYSIIVTQRVFSYDYDFLDIDHQSKTFSRIIDLDVQTILREGFIYTDKGIDSDYSYYIVDHSGDSITLVNDIDEPWTQYRKANPKHIQIPEGYTEIKEDEVNSQSEEENSNSN